MSGELTNLQERMSQLSSEDLLRVVTVDYGHYRKEALDIATNELARRGIQATSPKLSKEVIWSGDTSVPLSVWTKPFRYIAAFLFFSGFFYFGLAGVYNSIYRDSHYVVVTKERTSGRIIRTEEPPRDLLISLFLLFGPAICLLPEIVHFLNGLFGLSKTDSEVLGLFSDKSDAERQ